MDKVHLLQVFLVSRLRPPTAITVPTPPTPTATITTITATATAGW